MVLLCAGEALAEDVIDEVVGGELDGETWCDSDAVVSSDADETDLMLLE